MADTRFQFRMPESLDSALKAEAEKAGISTSEFCRQAVEAAIMHGWVARQTGVTVERAKPGTRQLGLRVILPADGCIHPPTAHETRVFDVVCGMCGKVLRRL